MATAIQYEIPGGDETEPVPGQYSQLATQPPPQQGAYNLAPPSPPPMATVQQAGAPVSIAPAPVAPGASGAPLTPGNVQAAMAARHTATKQQSEQSLLPPAQPATGDANPAAGAPATIAYPPGDPRAGGIAPPLSPEAYQLALARAQLLPPTFQAGMYPTLQRR